MSGLSLSPVIVQGVGNSAMSAYTVFPVIETALAMLRNMESWRQLYLPPCSEKAHALMTCPNVCVLGQNSHFADWLVPHFTVLLLLGRQLPRYRCIKLNMLFGKDSSAWNQCVFIAGWQNSHIDLMIRL